MMPASVHDGRHVPAMRRSRGPILGLVAGGAIGVAATLATQHGLGWPNFSGLPDTIWVAVITTSALVVQGWLSGRRESEARSEERQERIRDREVETHRREQERDDALAERWRDERKEAHANLLEAISLAMDASRAATGKAGLASLLGYSKEELRPFLDAAAQAHEKVEKQLAVVHLLASTSAAEAAEAAVGRLRGVWVMMLSFDMHDHNLERRNHQVKTAEERLTTVYEVRDAYRQAARQDIGTV